MAENYFYSSLSGQEIENRLIGGVLFNTDQTLTSSQKAIARANIGAGESNSTFKVLGYFNTLAEMQAALQTLPNLGDAYGIGTESPYDVYVYAMHMVDGQAVPGWVNQGPIDTSAAAFDDEDISVRTGWTSSKIASELTNVQRRLVIDDVPTLGSGNPVASGGVAVKMEWKKIVSENVSVPVNRWASSAKYDGYGFRAQIPIENVTADMIPEVIFDPADVSTGTFATIAESYNGGIYIYASEVPSAAITIPTIIVWRGDTGDGSDIPLIQIDPTLTVAGDAADAKAAGDAIRANATAIDAMQTSVDNKAGMLVDTASGAIASFTPDSTIPDLLGVTVDVEPVQDLHGYDNPWPGGAEKNKFYTNLSMGSFVKNGLTFTVQEDGQINVRGTATADTFQSIGYFTPQKGVSYILNGCPSGGSTSTYRMTLLTVGYDTGNGLMFTGAGTQLSISVDVYNGQTVNLMFKPMIRLASVSDATFAPYSNICPISGWDAVGIHNGGVNLLDVAGRTFGNTSPTTINLEWCTAVKDGDKITGTITGAWSKLRFGLNTGDFKAGQTYTLSAKFSNPNGGAVGLAYYDTNWRGTTITRDTDASVSISFVFDPSINMVGMILNNTSSSTGATVVCTEMQIVPGETVTPYVPYVTGNTYAISLGQTVYGGTLDVVNGVLTVDRASVDLGTLNWVIDSRARFQSPTPAVQGIKPASSASAVANILCSNYKTISSNGTYLQNIGISLDSSGTCHVYDPSFSDAATFKAAMSGVQLVYKLATPVTIQLDPVTISTISGQTNNVWSDAGDVDVTYAADIKAYIDRLNQSPEDDMIANTLIEANKYFTVNNRLFLSTASIAAGAQIIPGHNCTETSLVEVLNALNT